VFYYSRCITGIDGTPRTGDASSVTYLPHSPRRYQPPSLISVSNRFLHVEIETKIAYNVKQVLSGGREHLQDPAIGLLVSALSTSADWVELYVATGELEILGLDSVEGELGDAVRAVALVLFLDSGSDFDTHWF